MTNLPVIPNGTQGRECGACALCCRLLPVPELHKDAGTWCPDARPGAPGGGCSIHETRPAICRAFKCQWLQGRGEESWRPDRSGLIVCGRAELATGPALVLYAKAFPLSRTGEWALLYWTTQALALKVALVLYCPRDGLILRQAPTAAGLTAEWADPSAWHWERAIQAAGARPPESGE